MVRIVFRRPGGSTQRGLAGNGEKARFFGYVARLNQFGEAVAKLCRSKNRMIDCITGRDYIFECRTLFATRSLDRL